MMVSYVKRLLFAERLMFLFDSVMKMLRVCYEWRRMIVFQYDELMN